MEYNNNIYIVIETIYYPEIENHRTNNYLTKVIVEYSSIDEIPSNIQSLALSINTHQEILSIVNQSEWISELPF